MSERRRGPRLLVVRALLLLAAVSIVTTLWTTVVLLAVRSDLVQARTALTATRDSGRLAEAGPVLSDAERSLRRSDRRMHQLGPVLAAHVPVLGRGVAGIDRAITAATATVQASRRVLQATEPDTPIVRDGTVDLPALAALAQALEQAAASTRAPTGALRDQSLALVPGLVSGPVRQAGEELAPVPDTFAKAAAAVRSLGALLGSNGPRSLLLVLENNAELRGTGGLVSVFAQARAQDGRLTIGGFRDVEAVADPLGAQRPVPAPADFRRLYGPFAADTTLWKNSNMSPDLGQSSTVLANVAAATLGERPDLIVWLDVPAIAALLRATGPAELPDGSVLTGEQGVRTLLSDAYTAFPDTLEGQAARRGALRAAADAVLGKLLRGDDGAVSPSSLGRELSAAAAGRHVALWSGRPGERVDLAAAGLDGRVAARGGDLASFTVHNLGGGDRDGNKIDYYARRQLSVQVTLDGDEAFVQQELTLRNTAPTLGLPEYVAGRATPGVSNNWVTLAVPTGARDLAFSREGRPLVPTPAQEGDHQVLSDLASLSPGSVTSWKLQYRLPTVDGSYAASLYPQPLAVDAGMSLQVRTTSGRRLVAEGERTDSDGVLRLSGAFDRQQHLQLRTRTDGWAGRAVGRIKRFWAEPVTLG